VELTETAVILNTATPRSLVVLDGSAGHRKRSTELALAWAVVEYIHARTQVQDAVRDALHELTDLAEQLAGVRKSEVSVKEAGRPPSSSCARWSPGAPTAATESKWRAWPGCRWA